MDIDSTEFLSIGENVIYKFDMEVEGYITNVFLTNYRLIFLNEEDGIDSFLLKHIKAYGVLVGSDKYLRDGDRGMGEYGVYFSNGDVCTTIWLYSKKVWKEFYDELSRVIISEV